MFIYSVWHSFVHLLYPHTCISCNTALYSHESIICDACRFLLPRYDFAKKIYSPRLIGSTLFQFCISYLVYQKYNSKTQKILQALKYDGRKELSYQLGKWFGQELEQNGLFLKADYIIPIPLHPKKLKIRGYNQVDGFAQALSETFQIPWKHNILIRNTFTQTQTKLSRAQRWENVANVFEVKEPSEIQNKNVLLVDDVFTTGATVEAASVALQKANCSSIGVVTIASA
ncbi:MAG: ComF family protein [Cytophagales bacterium]|nr:ComF family protein [Cytophagales bacterium]MDW8383184.1 ComF family protein [Flammeovirgaceae bacterium]